MSAIEPALSGRRGRPARADPDSGAATEIVRGRYDRIAALYDVFDWPMELRARAWRRELWARVCGGEVLEIGVGTGKNFRFYPDSVRVTAVDLSPQMLARASKKASRLGTRVLLEPADAQALSYEDASFDCVLSSFVFCSVPDPVLGLSEALRVLKPGGTLLLLEHVLSERPWLRWLMRRLDPVSFRLWGAHLDRETVSNVETAGFEIVDVRALMFDVVRLIQARRPLA